MFTLIAGLTAGTAAAAASFASINTVIGTASALGIACAKICKIKKKK